MEQEKPNAPIEDRISVVELNEKLFGIDILKSKEIISLPGITPVPNSDEMIVGVFNLRGEIYSIIDISTILGMKPKMVRSSDMIILLENNRDTMGVIVDRIHGVQPVKNPQIKSAHGIVSKKMGEFIFGIYKNKQAEILLLNIERIFSSSAQRIV